MVIFVEWHRTAVDQRRRDVLPMTGEDTGLGALASPLAGYLGKVHERAGSLEHCPWCASKGLTSALRSYRINLQESITLCTNPQCLFPLVSRPLEDVLAGLDRVQPAVGNKRKNAFASEKEEATQPSAKRLRSSDIATVGQAEPDAVNGHVAENGYHGDCAAAAVTPRDEGVGEEEADNAAGLASPEVSGAWLTVNSEALIKDDFTQVKSSPEALSKTGSLDPDRLDITSTESKTPSPRVIEQRQASVNEDPPSTPSRWLVPAGGRPFWKNSDSLCWLDALLVALVNCRSLKTRKPEHEPRRSAVWRLLKEYEETCAAVQDHQQTGGDGVVRVPSHVLQKADSRLQGLRSSIFKLLQPKLRCELGQRETPVFAVPLLLMSDSWVEPLFQATFHWEFKCSECKTSTKERVTKTLPTFTNILPDWRPLHAVHSAQCGVCCQKDQRRTLTLERVPAVLALHFVQGLPDNDVGVYTFHFGGKRYSITTVIQYDQHLKHFVTWIRQPHGSWQEFDDLKHPDVRTYPKLPVPAGQMHIVFWEAAEDDEARVCSPSSTFAESKPGTNGTGAEAAAVADDRSPPAEEPSLLMPQDATDIICALSGNDIMDATVTAGDASIGSTTLLDAFEGLTPDDIITLTLVELKSEPGNQLPAGNGPTPGPGVPGRNDSPDSSFVAVGGKTSGEIPAAAGSPKPETAGGASPIARRTRGRRQGGKTKAAFSESPEAKCDESAASTVSSTETPPPPPPLSPAKPPSLDQNARWSFLLSKHPLHQVHTPVAKPALSQTPVSKPAAPAHSTPRPPPPPPARVFPKPQLRKDEGERLPLKAAEKYVAFGAKTPTGPPPANAVAPLPDRKRRSQASKLPPGLSDTEALRYKLIKKLKAKKKKLAKLNSLLGGGDGFGSAGPGSPNAVSSSTYDGSACDGLLSDLLSPATTTASNLSPDSTGFLEMLAAGQEGGERPDAGVYGEAGGAGAENFLEEFLSQAAAQRPTEMEAEALGALELFF